MQIYEFTRFGRRTFEFKRQLESRCNLIGTSNYDMIQSNEKQTTSTRKRKRELAMDKSMQEIRNDREKSESFLICNDCHHNTITYEPSKNGACDCGCH